ncbi:MAG TPA: tetratricopeptide repeat protein [Chryseosolibacter sp.]|nr:tetratricopeptide repeat protein [Chryseosolibacter sp.]
MKNHAQQDSIRVDILNQLAFDQYLITPEKSMEYAYEAVALAKDLGYAQGQAQGLRQVGIVLWTQANYGTALKNFLAGLKLAESIGNKQLIADLLGNVGLVYHGLGDYKEALRYHQRSLAMQRELQNKTRQAVALNNIGDVLRAWKNYEGAIEHYEEALTLRRETGNLAGVATNVRNIGNVFEDQGQFDKALVKYSESMAISDELKDKRGMSQCRQSIGSVYFKLKQPALAKKYLLESLEISRQARFRAFIRDCSLLLSGIYESENNPGQAFRFYKEFASYKDSVLNMQVGSEIASVRLEYEVNKKQNEIDLLRKDAELHQSALDRKNTLLVSGAVTLVLLMCLAIILYKNYTSQKRLNTLLGIKNREIEDQHIEICAQRDELMALNEEITAQQEDIIASRDALEQKNESIASMNEKILEINQNLERLVAERTAALEKQNRHLVEYAFINAHKVRGPLARVMGLANLLALTPCSEEQKKILQLLDNATTELDNITKSITVVVHNGIEAYEHTDKV